MDLQQRVERLERENRILKRAALSGVGLALLAALLGQAAPPQAAAVTTRKLAIVDEQGHERAVLGMVEGGPQLSLLDSKGRSVVQLEVPKVPDKAALYMQDSSSASGLELAMTMNGPVLHFSDKTGTRVRLATNQLNAPLASITTAEGQVLFQVPKE